MRRPSKSRARRLNLVALALGALVVSPLSGVASPVNASPPATGWEQHLVHAQQEFQSGYGLAAPTVGSVYEVAALTAEFDEIPNPLTVSGNLQQFSNDGSVGLSGWSFKVPNYGPLLEGDFAAPTDVDVDPQGRIVGIAGVTAANGDIDPVIQRLVVGDENQSSLTFEFPPSAKSHWGMRIGVGPDGTVYVSDNNEPRSSASDPARVIYRFTSSDNVPEVIVGPEAGWLAIGDVDADSTGALWATAIADPNGAGNVAGGLWKRAAGSGDWELIYEIAPSPELGVPSAHVTDSNQVVFTDDGSRILILEPGTTTPVEIGVVPANSWGYPVSGVTTGPDGTVFAGRLGGGLHRFVPPTISDPQVATVTSLEPVATRAYGQPLTLSATVASSVGPVTSGTVTFTDESTAVPVTLGAVPLDGSGTAVLLDVDLDAGAHAIRAVFSGADTAAASETTGTVVVDRAPVEVTTASSSVLMSLLAGKVIYRSTVRSAVTGQPVTGVPVTTRVQGSTPASGCVSTTNGQGVAECSVSLIRLVVGGTITASVPQTANYEAGVGSALMWLF